MINGSMVGFAHEVTQKVIFSRKVDGLLKESPAREVRTSLLA